MAGDPCNASSGSRPAGPAESCPAAPGGHSAARKSASGGRSARYQAGAGAVAATEEIAASCEAAAPSPATTRFRRAKPVCQTTANRQSVQADAASDDRERAELPCDRQVRVLCDRARVARGRLPGDRRRPLVFLPLVVPRAPPPRRGAPPPRAPLHRTQARAAAARASGPALMWACGAVGGRGDTAGAVPPRPRLGR